MNRRLRFHRSGLMCAVGALVVVAFFAMPSPAGYASTSCSDCYIVTPVTPPPSAAAGTGQQYAFQVTNYDPNESTREPHVHCARRFLDHRRLGTERDLGLDIAILNRHAEPAQ